MSKWFGPAVLLTLANAQAMKAWDPCPLKLVESLTQIVTYRGVLNRGEIRKLGYGAPFYFQKTYSVAPGHIPEDVLAESLPFYGVVSAEERLPQINEQLERYLEVLHGRCGYRAPVLRRLREVNRGIPQARQLTFEHRDPHTGRIVEFLRVIDGTLDHPGGGDPRLELEILEDEPVQERRDPSIAVLEVGQAYGWWDEDDHPTFLKEALTELATYIETEYVSKGRPVVLYAHTDKLGAERLFPSYGFKIADKHQTFSQKEHYRLRQTGLELLANYPSRRRQWEQCWNQRYPQGAMIELYRRPPDFGPQEPHPLRPTIALSPKWMETMFWRQGWEDEKGPTTALRQLGLSLEAWKDHLFRSVDIGF